MRAMTPFDMIRVQLGESVPFARHVGVRLTEIVDGAATAELDETPTSVNHIGSQHAGALFTLGETASGAAMAGLFSDRLLAIRPVTTQSSISYVKIAKGKIVAKARVDGDGAALKTALDRDGRVRFNVAVTLENGASAHVASMTVEWDVKRL